VSSREKKLGIALGSGSSRGFAHIGILRVFEDENIPKVYIAGTSIGAYIGAIYSAGAIKELEEFILSLDWKKLFRYYDLRLSKSGIFSGKKIMELLEMVLDGKNFEELYIPFSCVAVDIKRAKEVVFKSGDILKAIRASLSMPGVFTPVEYGDMLLVDGGIMNPVPVDIVKSMGADIVIAVDLSGIFLEENPLFLDFNDEISLGLSRRYKRKEKKSREQNQKLSNKLTEWVLKLVDKNGKVSTKPFIVDIVLAGIDIMISEITKLKLSIYKPDIIISPNLTDMRFIDFYRAKEAIDEGKKIAYKLLPKIKKLIGL